ncbi:MAG: hypothetical protein ACOZBH_01045 [Patescibacteria group bacterium]
MAKSKGKKIFIEAFPGQKGVRKFNDSETPSDQANPEELTCARDAAQRFLSRLPAPMDRALRVAMGIPAPDSLNLTGKRFNPDAQAQVEAIERRALDHLKTRKTIESLK